MGILITPITSVIQLRLKKMKENELPNELLVPSFS